ncbi:LOW QUALITY PROTEIN: Fanconi anemia core complex-associated protein 24 [Leucoraja erinacea]|uniref:LOW QUALITY PROTEIN: Fanconi anemia core complex-associated protein 24 n=1 Tax=Leucoraja erinaceus TaxID=7782 RepID=UPI002455DCED|nr:LOW QUALITY PROTEIN: Fanconi anemia core complex-associated protein 24 [Leucoraja erinacea]
MRPVWEVCAGVGSSRTEMDTGLDASVCSPPVRAGASAVPRGHVIASEKWRGSQLTVGCQGRVTVLYEDDLGLVDFHLSQRLCVLYVSESDLVAGNNYRRKLVRFRKASTLNGIVMVEKTPLSEQYFAGVQRFVVLDLGLTLLPVASPTEPASQLLAQLVQEGNRERQNPFVRRCRSGLSEAAVLASVQRIPGVGRVKALSLLRHYPSIQQLSTASPPDLEELGGPALARHLTHFFSPPS